MNILPYKNRKDRLDASKKSAVRWSKRWPEKARLKAQEWRLRNPRYFMYAAAKRRAKANGLIFSLIKEDIPEIPKVCPITLLPILVKINPKKGPRPDSPSLDKVDNEKGYVKDNIRIISNKANKWKSDMTVEEVERLLAYMKGEL